MNVEHDFLLFLFMKVSHLGGLLKLTLLATETKVGESVITFGFFVEKVILSQKNDPLGGVGESVITFGFFVEKVIKIQYHRKRGLNAWVE